MTLEQALAAIRPADEGAYRRAKEKWDSIAKPLDGLGLLEEAVCRAAGASGSAEVTLSNRVLAVFCSDNGVVAEGVTQCGSEVTTIVARNLCQGSTSVSAMARAAGCRVIPVDVGMLTDVEHPRMRRCKSAYGSGNIAREPAMTREQAVAAVECGVSLALECKEQGASLLAAGEVGIGNTTTSSAVACALLGRRVEELCGRGAGLSNEGLRRKIAAVESALLLNQPDPADPLDILAKVGGFDLAALCGFYLGAAAARLPVVLDGFISGVAALCAARLCPPVTGYLLASHASAEPGARLILEALGLRAMLHGNLHLGEGTGAVAMMPLLDLALAVYHQSTTFAESNIDNYVPQE